MIAKTPTELVTKVRDLTTSWDSNHFTDAQLYVYLNDAQQVWAEKTRCLWRYQTDTTVDGKQEYGPIFVNFFPCTVYAVTLAGTPLDALRWYEEVYAYSTTWSTTGGQPLKYYIRQNLLGLVPIPNASYAGLEIRLEGYREPSVIDASTCANIDAAHHKWLPFYAASIIAGIDERADLAARYIGVFNGEMQRVRSLYFNTTPGGRMKMAVSSYVRS